MAPAANASTTTAMSRTMQLAVSRMKVSATSRGDDSGSASAIPQRGGTWFSAPGAAAPRTKVEQYWAARALVAETFLSAHDRHQGELTEMRRIEEQKREVSSHVPRPLSMSDTNHYKREIGIILHANDQRQRRLERLMVSSNHSVRWNRRLTVLIGDVSCGSFRVHGLVGGDDGT